MVNGTRNETGKQHDSDAGNRSLVLRGMFWGIIILDAKETGNWLLLEQSIRDNPMESIEQMEAAFSKPWTKLQTEGCHMIRLNLTNEGRPTDLMFAWGSENVNANGIIPYSTEIEHFNNALVYE
jgi:hypothetical protein